MHKDTENKQRCFSLLLVGNVCKCLFNLLTLKIAENIWPCITRTRERKKKSINMKCLAAFFSLVNNSCTKWEINIFPATEKQSLLGGQSPSQRLACAPSSVVSSTLTQSAIKPFTLQESTQKTNSSGGLLDVDCCGQNTSQNV